MQIDPLSRLELEYALACPGCNATITFTDDPSGKADLQVTLRHARGCTADLDAHVATFAANPIFDQPGD